MKIWITISILIITRGDPARNEFTPEDDQLPEEPKYDKFAYENDKKMWGLDNGYNEDEDIDGMGAHGRKEHRLHHTLGTVGTEMIMVLPINHCLPVANIP